MSNLPIHSLKEHISVPCVIAESEIRAFIGDLKNRETRPVLTRLLVVVFASIELMHSRPSASLMKQGCCLLSNWRAKTRTIDIVI
jgi:hypothetical protein